MSDFTDLPPSRLGTKEHWDAVYSTEYTNFEEIGDEGEIWFGEDSVEKMVDWALENIPPSADSMPYILEVGAGNGNLLLALHEAGYAPDRMCGVDYSADAVRLAKAIADSRGATGEDEEDREEQAKGEKGVGPEAITFAECDFLAEDVSPLSTMPSIEGEKVALWNLVLDKGTFDAMALAGKDENGRSLADNYPTRVGRVVKPGGYFLITSCNFTEEELKAKFTTEQTGLIYHSRIAWPTFSFGGKSGNVYSSVAFQKPI
ncbi:S-adenosyl-L-methionine-dependent methyltransferase [Wolfiporia cocos MD-104 SS10]|uniref:Protein-lysine N-methyltransferase EFM4 n=1 Tax=Wolfiporia cocos (strain MD-104) TaxID=742152 RepID=A0A2H3K074_WOLCO|nr:S-adenosyl-L-methionine-dependent methyltransferase [Wolfiporia cocos MD-104 SS10]